MKQEKIYRGDLVKDQQNNEFFVLGVNENGTVDIICSQNKRGTKTVPINTLTIIQTYDSIPEGHPDRHRVLPIPRKEPRPYTISHWDVIQFNIFGYKADPKQPDIDFPVELFVPDFRNHSDNKEGPLFFKIWPETPFTVDNPDEIWLPNFNNIVPLPLSEPILKKLGFSATTADLAHEKGKRTSFNHKELNTAFFDLYTYDDMTSFRLTANRALEIKYVHELQNIIRTTFHKYLTKDGIFPIVNNRVVLPANKAQDLFPKTT